MCVKASLTSKSFEACFVVRSRGSEGSGAGLGPSLNRGLSGHDMRFRKHPCMRANVCGDDRESGGGGLKHDKGHAFFF